MDDIWRNKKKRAEQWIECGGADDGGYHLPLDVGSEHKEIVKANSKKFDQMQLCMMAAGYSYIGSCEGNIRSFYPACWQRALNQKKFDGQDADRKRDR